MNQGNISYDRATGEGLVRNKKKFDKKKFFFMATFLILPIINFFVFFVYVNINSIVMAFQRPIYDGASKHVFSLENFKNVFNSFLVDPDGKLRTALLNTLSYYITGTLIIFPVSLLMTYFVYKRIWGYKMFRFIAYLPQIITSAALVMLFKYALQSGGPVAAIYKLLGKTYEYPLVKEPQAQSILLFYNIVFGFGGNLVVYSGAMNSVNNEILEAGELDGCNWFQELIYLIVPAIWPTISTALILGLAGLLGSTGPVLPFTKGNYGTTTLAFEIYNLVSGVNGYKDLYYASAIGLTMTAFMLPIVFIIRHILYNEKKES